MYEPIIVVRDLSIGHYIHVDFPIYSIVMTSRGPEESIFEVESKSTGL